MNSTPTPSTPSDLSDRLVPLCDGRPGLRSGLQVQTSFPPEASADQPPIIDFLASSQALDRCDEMIHPAGWRLDNYRRNPVFQNAHQYGDIIFTLGKALLTEVREVGGRPALFQRVEFAVEVNPMARIAYGLYRGKFLNAVSVGFIPIRWENGGADAGYRRRYLEQELLEVSAVGIPANPEALQLGLRAGAIQKSDLHDLLELLRGLNEIEPDKPAALVPPESSPDRSLSTALPHARFCGHDAPAGAQWLQLARALRELLGRS